MVLLATGWTEDGARRRGQGKRKPTHAWQEGAQQARTARGAVKQTILESRFQPGSGARGVLMLGFLVGHGEKDELDC